jgi:hypothetical protein
MVFRENVLAVPQLPVILVMGKRGTEGKGSGGEIKVRKNQPAPQLTKRVVSGVRKVYWARNGVRFFSKGAGSAPQYLTKEAHGSQLGKAGSGEHGEHPAGSARGKFLCVYVLSYWLIVKKAGKGGKGEKGEKHL